MLPIIAPFLTTVLTGSFGSYAKIVGFAIAAVLALISAIFVMRVPSSIDDCKKDKTVGAVTGVLAAIVYFVSSVIGKIVV